MSETLPHVDLKRIRQHEGSQHHAWEELSYILVPDIDRLPRGTVLERHAAPDGGVEFSCAAPAVHGKGRWAWQAKFLHRLDASAFAQMDDSIEAALAEYPDLTRYTFVLPVERTGRGSKGGRSGLEKWHERVEKWRKQAAERDMDVRFDYVGRSEVLKSLLEEEHAGVLRYFFDERTLTDEFFQRQVEREIRNLGERYDPDVHVDLDIGESIDAVCRSPRFARRLLETFADLGRCSNRFFDLQQSLDESGEDADVTQHVKEARQAGHVAAQGAEALADRLRSPDGRVFSELATLATHVDDAALAAETLVQERLASLRAAETACDAGEPDTTTTGHVNQDHDEEESRKRTLYAVQGRLLDLRSAVQQAKDLLDSRQSLAARAGALLLVGPAGCGKSHLVAEAARSRARDGMPTLLLLGQHFDKGDVWAQISDIVDVNLTASDLLKTLEVAARVRGSGRALIVVDAANEGAGADLWPGKLGGFLNDVAGCPWVAVVLTVRDTFKRAVLPPDLPADALVEMSHPGLAGHEGEALARYAGHYDLRLPDIPTLHPELTNPLFLRNLCRSVQARGLQAIPRQSASLSWVFSGLLDAANKQLSHSERLDFDPCDDLVDRTVRALADAMLDAGGEVLPLRTAKDICDDLHAPQSYSTSLLLGLINEGLLVRERTVPRDGGSNTAVEHVRFTYQRLGDHLRAEALLDRYVRDKDLAAAIRRLAAGERAWSTAGLIEALALIVPERRGVELPTLLGLEPSGEQNDARRPPPRARAERDEWWLRHELARSFLAALLWRTPASVDARTMDLANRYLDEGLLDDKQWLELRLSLACIPDHPLNIRSIDKALGSTEMSERDASWSSQVLDIWADDGNPIERTIDWAWSGKKDPPDDVAELAATLLTWLFTSPNRRLRDTATKALLRLAERRTGLLVGLLDAFADVDDPYVLDRLLAVISGHVIRHRYANLTDEALDDLTELGQRAFDLVFDGVVPEHLLIRHYAQTCVDIVHDTLAAHGRSLDRDLSQARPPYESSWPLTAPGLRDLARSYGRKPSRWVWAVSEIGSDFDEYIIARGVVSEFVLPNQRRRQAARNAARRRKLRQLQDQLLRHLPMAERERCKARLDRLTESDASPSTWQDEWNQLRNAVPAAAVEIVDELKQAVRHMRLAHREPVRPDPGVLSRWIAQRVLDFGWTKERFGAVDQWLGRSRHGYRGENERFGKKYTWIAFHQLLGHLTDHCALQERWMDAEPQLFEDPWQIRGAVDIDPTLLIRGDEPPDGTSAARLRRLRVNVEREGAWWLAPYRHRLTAAGYGGDWLGDPGDVPRPESLLVIADPQGDEWLVLESHVTWELPEGDDGGYRPPSRQFWVRTQANVIPAAWESDVSRWAAEQNWMGLWMPSPSDHLHGPVAGYPDMRPWQRAIQVSGDERQSGYPELLDLGPGWEMVNERDAATSMMFPVALATATHAPGRSRDFSATDVPHAILPAPILVDLLGGAHLARPDSAQVRTLALGEVEAEYSWLISGEIVAFASGGRSFGSTLMLCVRADPLRRALAEAGLALWTWVLGEKIYWTGEDPSSDRAEIFAAAGLAPSFQLWGMTVEYQGGWVGGVRPRRPVLRERTLST